jgi:hypothetical protein
MNSCIAPLSFHFPKVHRGMTFRRSLVLVLLTCIAIGGQGQVRKLPPYKNAKLPVEKRVEDLLSRMTLEEKFWQLFMTPGDIASGKEKYRHGIFGLQMATRATSNKVSEQLMQYGSSGTARAAAEKISAISSRRPGWAFPLSPSTKRCMGSCAKAPHRSPNRSHWLQPGILN